MSNDTPALVDITRIMEMIPHRYPILLVDKIIELNKGESIVGVKNVTMNEPHFQGHFPGHPVMPGVLIIEAMAQASGILVMDTFGSESEGKVIYFMSIEEAKFRKPVTPGDVMHLHVKKIHARGTVWKFKGEAMVNGKIYAQAKFTAMIVDAK